MEFILFQNYLSESDSRKQFRNRHNKKVYSIAMCEITKQLRYLPTD